MLAQARGYSHSPQHPSRGGLFQKDLRLLTFLDRRGLSRGGDNHILIDHVEAFAGS
jgi:hypothetical protein